MAMRSYVAKRKYRLHCDYCGCVLRGVENPSSKKQFDFYIMKEDGEISAVSCRDLCVTCRRWLGKIGDKIVRKKGYREPKHVPRKPSEAAIKRAQEKAEKLKKTAKRGRSRK